MNGSARNANVLAVTIAALRRSAALHDSNIVRVACRVLGGLAKDAESAARFGRNGIVARVVALQLPDGWTREEEAVDQMRSACFALKKIIAGSGAEQAVAAGAVPALVSLLRNATGGHCTWTHGVISAVGPWLVSATRCDLPGCPPLMPARLRCLCA